MKRRGIPIPPFLEPRRPAFLDPRRRRRPAADWEAGPGATGAGAGTGAEAGVDPVPKKSGSFGRLNEGNEEKNDLGFSGAAL